MDSQRSYFTQCVMNEFSKKRPSTDGIRQRRPAPPSREEAFERGRVPEEHVLAGPAFEPVIPEDQRSPLSSSVEALPAAPTEAKALGRQDRPPADVPAPSREPDSSSWIAGYRTRRSAEAAFFRNKASGRIRIKGSKTLWWGLASGMGVLIVLMVLLSTVFANVAITGHVKTETVDIGEIPLLLDVSASGPLASERVIPAESLTFSKGAQEQFPATGESLLDVRARGQVRIYNNYGAFPQPLVATTRFLTEQKVLYRIPKDVVVPGATVTDGAVVPTFVETELVADRAGEAGNVLGETKLSIPGFVGSPKHAGFYAVAASGFSGGMRGTSTVVTASDVQQASQTVSKHVVAELERVAAEKIPQEFRLVDALNEVSVTKLDAPSPGAGGETFTVTAQAEARVLIFRDSDVTAVLGAALLSGDKSRELVADLSGIGYAVRDVDFAKGIAHLDLTGTVKIRAVVDPGEIVALVQGKKKGTMSAALRSVSGVDSFGIRIFPPWRSRAPHAAHRIHVRMK